MVIANTKSGVTKTYDVSDDHQYAALLTLLEVDSVTGLSTTTNKIRNVLTLPRRFRGVPVYGAERVLDRDGMLIGERIYCHAGDVVVSITGIFGSPVVRFDTIRMGRRIGNGCRSNASNSGRW